MPARVDLPLIRRRDRNLVGSLAFARANHPAFTDEHGSRRVNPIRLEQLLITPTDAKGETICSLELAMERLPPDQS
jgi:hypothetical protein